MSLFLFKHRLLCSFMRIMRVCENVLLIAELLIGFFTYQNLDVGCLFGCDGSTHTAAISTSVHDARFHPSEMSVPVNWPPPPLCLIHFQTLQTWASRQTSRAWRRNEVRRAADVVEAWVCALHTDRPSVIKHNEGREDILDTSSTHEVICSFYLLRRSSEAVKDQETPSWINSLTTSFPSISSRPVSLCVAGLSLINLGWKIKFRTWIKTKLVIIRRAHISCVSISE